MAVLPRSTSVRPVRTSTTRLTAGDPASGVARPDVGAQGLPVEDDEPAGWVETVHRLAFTELCFFVSGREVDELAAVTVENRRRQRSGVMASESKSATTTSSPLSRSTRWIELPVVTATTAADASAETARKSSGHVEVAERLRALGREVPRTKLSDRRRHQTGSVR